MMQVDCLDATFEIDETYLDASPDEIRRQIAEYERGERDVFDVGVTFPDSFLGQVMEAMDEIPLGETRTYGDIAADLDTAAVAVGQACGRNPVSLVVPCHRVVGADGGLVGYGNDGGIDVKRRLLVHEGARFDE